AAQGLAVLQQQAALADDGSAVERVGAGEGQRAAAGAAGPRHRDASAAGGGRQDQRLLRRQEVAAETHGEDVAELADVDRAAHAADRRQVVQGRLDVGGQRGRGGGQGDGGLAVEGQR